MHKKTRMAASGRKALILQTLIGLCEKGRHYQAVSLSDIATELKVSKNIIPYHLGSVANLNAELIEYATLTGNSTVLAQAAAVAGGDK